MSQTLKLSFFDDVPPREETPPEVPQHRQLYGEKVKSVY